MADLPVRPWHTLLARSLPRSALATPFVSCTVGGNEGNDRWHGNNAVHDMPISHGSSSEYDATLPDANGRSDALTVPLLDYPHSRGPPSGEPGAPHRSGIIRAMRDSGGAAARRGAHSTRPSPSRQSRRVRLQAFFTTRASASFSSPCSSSSLLFTEGGLYFFTAQGGSRRRTSSVPPPAQARGSPPGKQGLPLPASGYRSAGGPEGGDAFTQ